MVEKYDPSSALKNYAEMFNSPDDDKKANDILGNSATGTVFLNNLPGAGASIHLLFAALQLELARTNKEKAMTYMEDIKADQTKTKQIADYISQARALKLDAEDAKGKNSNMPDDMKQFYDNNGIKYYKTNDTAFTGDEWKYNIESLEKYMETMGTDTQQKMVYIQDFMGQYNSYLTGANSVIQKNSETLAALTRIS
ncbi:MAG: USH1C-binding protein 1 [Deltaproteobacteria bacterium]|jgi:hypothetical protein|nr:USH1C-binding protein 1 [Deltaproteobacteria bacterium]